jgi:hypothetical protein
MINGDSEYILISFLDADGAALPLVTGDTVYFSMKKKISDEQPALQKTVTSFIEGKAHIEILPADTINLKGGYYYDVQVNRADGQVSTVIKPSQIIIETGVTA